MHLYKYTNFQNLKFILNGSIRFTQPKAFNDPFELVPELYFEDGIEIRYEALDPDIAPTVPHPALLEDSFESTFCNDTASRDLLNTINDHVGILCLSKKYNSLLMWGHYADNYKGVIISFDSTHPFFEHKFDIQYRATRPKLNFQKLLNDKKHVTISDLCYKPIDWEYENEVRLLAPISECKKTGNKDGFDIYTKNIPIECIKSITLGERTPIEQQREIFGLIMNSNIELYLSAISNWGYNFRPEIIKMAADINTAPPVISPRTAHIFSELDNATGEMARWMIENHHLSKIVNKNL